MAVPYAAAANGVAQAITMACGSQMSKSEFLLNVLGHRLDEGPYVPALVVEPTEALARSFARDRFDKMIDGVPDLADKQAQGHAKKVVERYFNGIRLGFAHAGSATQLASNPAGLVCFDELDRCDQDTGGEGDPYSIVDARLITYALRLLIAVSSPTIEGLSAIWRLFLEGSREVFCWVCPDCGALIVPRFANLRWPKDSTPAQAATLARIVCPECRAQFADADKPALNAAGLYVPHRQDDNGELVADDDPPDVEAALHRSFWIPGLASPWNSLGTIAGKMLSALRCRDPNVIQARLNTLCGEPYRARGERAKWQTVAGLADTRPEHELPEWAQVITMGVDCQQDRLVYVVRAWGHPDSTSALITRGQLLGDPSLDQVWIALQSLAYSTWSGMGVSLCLIDSGWRPGQKWRLPTHKVYDFTARHHGLTFPSKGHGPGRLDRTWKITHPDKGTQLINFDADYWKTWLYGRLDREPGTPGEWRVFADIDQDYCQQIVSEELIHLPSGGRSWLVRGDNHFLDCEVLAAVAATVRGVPNLAPKAPPVAPNRPGGTDHAPAVPNRYQRRPL